jgi:hypothetical protein
VPHCNRTDVGDIHQLDRIGCAIGRLRHPHIIVPIQAIDGLDLPVADCAADFKACFVANSGLHVHWTRQRNTPPAKIKAFMIRKIQQ